MTNLVLIDKLQSIIESCETFDQMNEVEHWISRIARNKFFNHVQINYLLRICLKHRKKMKRNGGNRAKIFREITT